MTPTGRSDPRESSDDGEILITGGAGFVGSNLAHHLLSAGRRVVVLDNLSRTGVEQNLHWLAESHGSALCTVIGDVRDADTVSRAMRDVAHVFHLAAQVAVTTSLVHPVDDFETNARGTLNVLEAAREQKRAPSLLFTSTNKVYGGLDDISMACNGLRYEPADGRVRARGIGEDRPLDFHSPYGCSKGAADHYVRDYARSYGLHTTVFRMSCIYGPRQFGTEDQGWLAHFLIRAMSHQPIVLYGDGMQVRDVLFVDDLVDAMTRVMKQPETFAGRAFNIGGGPLNATSLLELLDIIAVLHGERPDIEFQSWRTGDQRYYVSDTREFARVSGWEARVGVRDGVAALHQWLLHSGIGSTGASPEMLDHAGSISAQRAH